MSSDDPDKAATAKDGPAPDIPSDAAAAKVTDGGPPTATEEKPKEQVEAKVPDEPTAATKEEPKVPDEPSTTKEPTAPVTDGPPSEAKEDKTEKPKVPDEPATEPPKDSATTEGSDEPSTDTSKDSATTEGSEDEAPAPEPSKAPEDQPKKADEKKSEEEAPAPEPPKAPEDQPKKADKKKSEDAAKEPKKKADKKKKSKSEESVASVSTARLQPRKVPVNSFKDVRPAVQKSLAGLKYPFIKKLEKQAGMDREKLFYSALAVLSFYLVIGPGNTFLSALIVKAWPVYQTILTVHTQNKKDDTQWLAFWCAFAAFSVLDHFFAPLELLFGLYLLFKTAALLYLGLPQTYGAHNLYVKHVHPLVDLSSVAIVGFWCLNFYVDEHFRTRKWKLGEMRICHKIGDNGTKQMQIVNSDGNPLPIPQNPLPNKVTGFRHIHIFYIDQNPPIGPGTSQQLSITSHCPFQRCHFPGISA
ncbi:hypothetical protein niasHT_017170 [Heterodera trifolii]|uniref:Uncharacterized protein n=1 Tax=Heterodera trifolii TaxID=157864 RepID=A0ABD2L7W1_9BILA